jgi:hypothetical protein
VYELFSGMNESGTTDVIGVPDACRHSATYGYSIHSYSVSDFEVSTAAKAIKLNRRKTIVFR